MTVGDNRYSSRSYYHQNHMMCLSLYDILGLVLTSKRIEGVEYYMNEQNLRELIKRYEANLEMVNGKDHFELFKWQAIKHFHDK